MPMLLNLDEAAEFLKCSKSFLYKSTCAKKIPYIKLGSRVLFEEPRLVEWLSARRVEPIRLEMPGK